MITVISFPLIMYVFYRITNDPETVLAPAVRFMVSLLVVYMETL